MDTTVVILVRSLFVDISLVDMLFQMAAMVISIDDTMSFLLLPTIFARLPAIIPSFLACSCRHFQKPIRRLFYVRYRTKLIAYMRASIALLKQTSFSLSKSKANAQTDSQIKTIQAKP